MFVAHDPNTLVDDLDIVLVDADPSFIEGGSSDADPSLPFTTFSVTITAPMITPSFGMTFTEPAY
jgi:hypothetical protein